jgi:hypothetical protein
MFENSSTWFIQNELTQSLILLNPAGLLPDTVPWRRRNTSDNDLTNFSLCMTGNYMYYFG